MAGALDEATAAVHELLAPTASALGGGGRLPGSVAVPDFQTLMRPTLVALEDGADLPIRVIRDKLAADFVLTAEDREERLPSGRQKTFDNRVGWAATYLLRCGLLDRPRRSVYRITTRGRQVLGDYPERVDLKVLAQFPEFEEFRSATRRERAPEPQAATSDETPEERIDAAYRELRSALAAELLDRVMEQTPDFFEQLVLDVLHAMGYGGSREDAAERLGKSGDEGVDGVIREDRLGLDLLYVQAKRWAAVVGRPDIQKFVGALHGQRAAKGVFITTSSFSRDAVDYADSVTPRVILIEGRELAQLMIDYGVGVATARSYDLSRTDSDYFAADDDGGGAS